MVTITFMDNSTQVVRVSPDFFKPTPISKKNILSVKDKTVELAWSFKRKPAKVSLTKGSEVVFEEQFGVPNTVGHAIKTRNNISSTELKHLKNMFKNQPLTTFVKR